MARPTKNKHDKRYQNSEARLRQAFLAEARARGSLFTIETGRISRRAGLNSATFHHHYTYKSTGLKSLARNIEHDYLTEYSQVLKRIAKYDDSISELARGTLLFIARHKSLVLTTSRLGYTDLFEQMGKRFWRYVHATPYRYGAKRIQTVFIYGYTSIILCWVREERCDPNKIEQYARYLSHLSRTGIKQLNFLADEP